jgi:ribosomal protein S18 acetylase RimI-like enzyme
MTAMRSGFQKQFIRLARYNPLLLRHALSSLQPPVRLYTFQQNTGAPRFYERFGFKAVQFTDRSENEERCPDVLYELHACHAGA